MIFQEQSEQLHNQSTSSADASNGVDADGDPGWAPLIQITGLDLLVLKKNWLNRLLVQNNVKRNVEGG